MLQIQIHLAGSQNQCSALWDDTNKRHRCHLHFYPESEPGFAEYHSSPVYDRVSSRLAWSRALECLKFGFGWPGGGGNWEAPEPELVWEGYWRNIYESATRQFQPTSTPDMLHLMVGGGAGDPDFDQQASVNCLPSGIGGWLSLRSLREVCMCELTRAGSSPTDIASFYSSEFIPSGPPSQHIRLLTRTAGPDRVVDELLLTFEHTEEIPWLLPNVPPTGRFVRIPIVMTANFLAGKIARHNVYWDQASVLVQIGLLDPCLIPSGFNTIGPNREGNSAVERMPVVGEEAVERVLT